MPRAAALTIVSLDPDDDDAFAAYSTIHLLAEAAGTDHPVPFQPGELRVYLRDTSAGERWEGLLGHDQTGTPVVAGLITMVLTDNLDKAGIRVWVAPPHRRRGYGSAMLQALLSRAAEEGRTTLLAHASYPVGADDSHPARAFASCHGFRLANSELHRILDLPVPGPRLAELARQAAPHHEGYRLVDHVDDDVPADLLTSYLDLVNALMADAPTGEVDYEAGAMTPELFHADMAAMRAAGRILYRTIALDAAGTAAAHSVLCVPREDPGKAFQFGTLVRQAHRGHRLGLAVKVRNLATVQALHPDRSVVHTWNAASNTHMIAINEALGFRVVSESAEYVRHVDN
jgi:GNAT superfamily N-acetyltransferase